MDPSHYSGSRYPAYNPIGTLQPRLTALDFEQYQPFNQHLLDPMAHHVPTDYPSSMLPTPYAIPYHPVGTLPVRGDWHQPPTERGPSVRDRPTPVEIFPFQPRRAYPSYTNKAIQTVGSDPTSAKKSGQDRPQTHRRPTPRVPAPQETYKPAQHHAEFAGSNVIEFVVDGREGIRLSDASEGNWVGLEGRDDRSLFEGDRLQIIFRLHLVGCSPWQSKIPTTDFTKLRRPITRMKLAAEVAKTMKKFIAREKMNGHNGRCGWGVVSLKNVFLARMIRVSAASWQPEFLVERPPVLTQVASSSSLSPNPIT